MVQAYPDVIMVLLTDTNTNAVFDNILILLTVIANDVNILGGRVHTVKENAKALVVAAKEIGLEVNVDKTKYMVMSRGQNAGRTHSMKTDNGSFERVE
jgi:hypothetical protein